MHAGLSSQPSSIAWAPESTDSLLDRSLQTVVGAVLMPPNPHWEDYHLALGLRLQKLVQSEPNGIKIADAVLSQAGLLDVALQNVPEEELASALVLDNWVLLSRLNLMNLPGEVPEKLQENPETREQLEDDSLEAWLNAVTWLPVDEGR